MKVRFLLFAKAPQPGKAKTRLIPALGAEGAARLAARMLDHALAQLPAAKAGLVELCAEPALGDPAWAGFKPPAGVATSAQGGGDLGQRMARAAKRTIAQSEAAILVGTDCPAMNAERLQKAAAALVDHDAVIHPAADGGYVLLGLRRFDSRLFSDIPWGTDQVAAITLRRLAELDWRVAIHETLQDIDLPEDLAYLPDGLEARPPRSRPKP